MKNFSPLIAALCLFWGPAAVGVAQPPANLLENAGFEQGMTAWRPLGSRQLASVVAGGQDGGHALQYAREASQPESNSHVDQEVDVQPGQIYVAGGFFRAEGALRPVIRVASMEWDTLAMEIAEPADGVWTQVRTMVEVKGHRRVKFQIFGGATTTRRETTVGRSLCDNVFFRQATEEELHAFRSATVRIDVDRLGATVDPRFFGTNALFMMEDDAAWADGSLAASLKELPCGLLRYPGGEMADNYHWKTHRLDDPHHWPGVEGPETTDTDEFMRRCRQVGAEPIFVVNLESCLMAGDLASGVAEAADWVRYCNVQRKYGIRYWEIGNESYLKGTRFPLSARQYAQAYVAFAKAMKQVDSSVQIGAIGLMTPEGVSHNEPQETRSPWWPVVVEIAGPWIDFAVVHHYQSEREFEAYCWRRLDAGQPIRRLKEFLHRRIPGRTIPIALTEWNSGRYTGFKGIANGLLVAELATDYLRAGTEMANFWPLRYRSKTGNFRALVDYDSNAPEIPYLVLQELAATIGDRVATVESSNIQLPVFATQSGDQNRLTVVCLNKSPWPEGMDVELLLDGVAGEQVSGSVLAADAPGSDSAVRRRLAVSLEADRASLHLPPLSIGTVRVTR